MDIDTKLGIPPQILAVLEILSFNLEDEEFSRVYTHTWAWYNGREKGFVLEVTDYNSRDGDCAMLIFCYEHRNSDRIMVARELHNNPQFSAPNIDDGECFWDETYQSAESFGSDIQGAVTHIVGWIEDFHNERLASNKED